MVPLRIIESVLRETEKVTVPLPVPLPETIVIQLWFFVAVQLIHEGELTLMD